MEKRKKRYHLGKVAGNKKPQIRSKYSEPGHDDYGSMVKSMGTDFEVEVLVHRIGSIKALSIKDSKHF